MPGVKKNTTHKHQELSKRVGQDEANWLQRSFLSPSFTTFPSLLLTLVS
jgi:hypothetical protein